MASSSESDNPHMLTKSLQQRSYSAKECTCSLRYEGTVSKVPPGCHSRLLYLSSDALGDLGVRNVIYLVRANAENAQQIAEQIKATNRQVAATAQCDYTVDDRQHEWTVAQHQAARNKPGSQKVRKFLRAGNALVQALSMRCISCRGGP
jgi:hypothetical protein